LASKSAKEKKIEFFFFLSFSQGEVTRRKKFIQFFFYCESDKKKIIYSIFFSFVQMNDKEKNNY